MNDLYEIYMEYQRQNSLYVSVGIRVGRNTVCFIGHAEVRNFKVLAM
jgi:hypothetical protein